MITYKQATVVLHHDEDVERLRNALLNRMNEADKNAMALLGDISDFQEDQHDDNDEPSPFGIIGTRKINAALWALDRQIAVFRDGHDEAQRCIDGIAAGGKLVENALVSENGLHQIVAITSAQLAEYGGLRDRIMAAMGDHHTAVSQPA